MSDRGQATLFGRVGWLIVLVVSALLVVYGVTWFFVGPETALENIAERTTLGPGAFREGNPSALDVIGIVTRQGAVFMAGLGLATLASSWHGFRTGSTAAWRAAWILPLTITAYCAGILLSAPGAVVQALAYFIVAVVAAIGLAVAYRRRPS
jgi:hypothetical protein